MTSFACHGCGAGLIKTWQGRDPKWCSERCRKASYCHQCIDCGGPCNLDGRATNASVRCLACYRRWQSSLESRRVMSAAHTGRVFWTHEKILDVLRRVATNGRLTCAEYDAAYVPGHMPSRPTINNRFGRWNNALEAAGLQTTEPVAVGWGITFAAAVMAVEDCRDALGRLPSSREYDEWATSTGAPSLAGIRKTGRWIDLLEAAANLTQVAA